MTEIIGSEQNNIDCEAVLQTILAKDFTQWHGLPATCRISDIVSLFSLSKGVGSGRLGDAKVNFRTAAVDGYSRPIRIWFEEERILLIDIAQPEIIPDLDHHLAVFGAPDVKLDSYLSTLLLNESEWVYLSRGISFFINPATQVLLRVAIFTPTSLEKYKAKLRLNLKKRRLPLRRR